MAERVPALFLSAMADLMTWLEGAGAPAMIVGGVAASLLGRPRATRDIDALTFLPEEKWAALLSDAANYRIVPRIDEPAKFARRSRVLLLRHIESSIDIDVILGALAFEEEAIGRGQLHDLGALRIRLPQVEDLVIMKAVAQRPQDLRDIEGLLDGHPDADIERVRRWVREFAKATGMQEMIDSLERILVQRGHER